MTKTITDLHWASSITDQYSIAKSLANPVCETKKISLSQLIYNNN